MVGETLTEPPDTGVTLPTPLSMLADVALALVHDNADDPPLVIDVGLATNVPVGADGWTTVTVACSVVCPPGPFSVSV